MPAAQHGQFYGGDSYILLYTYKKGKNDAYILYFWLGNDSTPDEKGELYIKFMYKTDLLNE